MYNMKVLHLTLKKKWFDMIASGEKKEEYREIKPYWERRFNPVYIEKFGNYPPSSIYNSFNIKQDVGGRIWDAVCFYNGGSPSKKYPHFLIECKGIETGKAKPEWSDNWQGEVFVIKLGEIITP